MPARDLGFLRPRGRAAGLGHVCALTATGDAYCWGDNSVLQLGGR